MSRACGHVLYIHKEERHEHHIRPSHHPQGGGGAGGFAGDSRVGAGQAHGPVLRGVLGQGHPRGHDPHARQGRRGRRQDRAVLRRHAVQAGHRARRAAARQPRDEQRSAAGHQQAAARLVDPDLGVPVPRREPPQRLLRERPRHGDEANGRGAAQGQDPRADVLRHAPGRAQAQEEDQHARGPRGDQAAHAGRRRLAAPRPLDRRESRRRSPTRRPTPRCRRGRSTGRTIRCRTCRT